MAGALLQARVQRRPVIARQIHHALLGWVCSFSFALLFQGLLSVTVGGQRPGFLQACNPEPRVWVYNRTAVCQNEVADNYYRSFPCGHCSFSL